MTTTEFVRNFQSIESTLFAFALKITRNHQDALDLVQEAGLKGFRHRDRFAVHHQPDRVDRCRGVARRRLDRDRHLAGGAGVEPHVGLHPRRDELQKALANDGVGTLIHYPVPPHLSGAYADMGFQQGSFPIAEKIANEVLSLPIGPHLDDASVDYVIESVRRNCKTLRS